VLAFTFYRSRAVYGARLVNCQLAIVFLALGYMSSVRLGRNLAVRPCAVQQGRGWITVVSRKVDEIPSLGVC
jgi:hypothetical protein